MGVQPQTPLWRMLPGATPGTTCLRSVPQKQSPRRRSRCTWLTGRVLSGEGGRKALGEGVASAKPTTRGLIRGVLGL